MRYLFILVLSFFVCTAVVWGAELRVVDSHGLTRAVREVQGKTSVEFEISPVKDDRGDVNHSDILILRDTGGANSSLQQQIPIDGRVRFLGVAPSTWEFEIPGLQDSPSRTRQVRKVKIGE